MSQLAVSNISVAPPLLSTIILLFATLLWFASPIYAHSPHDVVKSLAISPQYGIDQTLFIYVHDELKRSTDGGHSWKNLENGLDINELVSDIKIASDQKNGYRVFIATGGDGVYQSIDRGDSWQSVNTGLSEKNISSLVISPNFDDDHLLVAVTHDGGLYISTNAADSWHQVANQELMVTAATILNDQGSSKLLVGTKTGEIFISNAQFGNWLKRGEIHGAGHITSISLLVTSKFATAIYIGTEFQGLLKTSDLGKTFQNVKLPTVINGEPKIGNLHVSSITTLRNNNGSDSIFITTWDEAVFTSNDGGVSWLKLDSGIKKHKQADELKVSHFYKVVPSVSFNENGVIFVAGFAGLFKTVDKGVSWLEINTRPARNIEGLTVSPYFFNDHLISLATYEAGAYVSTDSGLTWITRNIGLEDVHLWDVVAGIAADTKLKIYTITNRSFLSTINTSFNWLRNEIVLSSYWRFIKENFDDGSIISKLSRRILGRSDVSFPTQIAISPQLITDKTMFLGTRRKGVLKTTDGGVTWNNPWLANKGWILAIKVSPNFELDNIVVASVRRQGFYMSTDRGRTWRAMNDGLSLPAIEYKHLGTSIIEISPGFAHDKTIYFGTADGLYRSFNTGSSWDRLSVISQKQKINIRSVGLSPNYIKDGMILVSVKGYGLYRSIDRGSTFLPVAEELIQSNMLLKLIRFSPNYTKDRIIFAASAEEAFVSYNAGDSWQKLERPIRYENTTDIFNYFGQWEVERKSNYSVFKIHQSNVPNAKVDFHFNGEQAIWYGPKSQEHGMANVYVDGEFVSKVDQYSTKELDFREIYKVVGLRRGAHVITIEVLGERNKNALDNFIGIDAMDVF